jgi:uncharacterized membrane protein
MSKKKILLAGESWEIFSIHIKGFDSFYTSKYAEGASWLIQALEEAGFQVDFIPNHHAPSKFPTELSELKEYAAVILSDIGSNTLLIHPDTFEHSLPTPNRLKLIRDYVKNGGSFLMIGGYMSFQGIDGKARYKDTPIEEILPVEIMPTDDRVEVPEGLYPTVSNEHDIIVGIEKNWPMLLGYNRFSAKDSGKILVTWEEDPILVIGEYGEGRTAAFASDCAPHWGSPAFVEWKDYNRLWKQLLYWMTGE